MSKEKTDKEYTSNLLGIIKFMNEFSKEGGLSKEIADKIEALWNKYKQSRVNKNCALIDAQFGKLGSLQIYQVKSSEFNEDLKYQYGSYDYVSIEAESKQSILWTDWSTEQPYNRQGGLYCGGASFEYLGKPVIEDTDKGYREFIWNRRGYNTTFGVWGFMFNDIYGTVHFGMSIDKQNLNDFISELRKIIDKPENK